MYIKDLQEDDFEVSLKLNLTLVSRLQSSLAKLKMLEKVKNDMNFILVE